MKNRLIFLFCLVNSICYSQIVLDSIPDGSGYTYIASPMGPGPFPAVLYNHGGLGPAVGGDLRGTVVALAMEGYIARAEKRMETTSIAGHLEEVQEALDLLRADPRTDTTCVTIMGFSRGGYLALEEAKAHPHKVEAIISMSPANPIGLLSNWATNVSSIDDPTLILSVENDTLQDQHVELAEMVYDSLISLEKVAFIEIYPSYDANEDQMLTGDDDGHELFFEVQQPYWSDVLTFLSLYSCGSSGQAESSPISPIQVYPNPFNENTSIHFNDYYGKQVEILIYNIQGALEKRISNVKSKVFILNREYLLDGLYFIQIKNDSELVYTNKLKIE